MRLKERLRKFNERERNEKIILIFIDVMLVSIGIFIIDQLVRVFFLNKKFFSNPIFGSFTWDFFNDFFAINLFVYKGNNPYTSSAMSSYPPLGLMIAKFFALFGNYSAGTYAVRRTILGAATYHLFFIVCTVLTCLAGVYIAKKRGIYNKSFFIALIVLIFSTPYIYLYGRGNYLLLSLSFLSWFFVWYDSEKKWQRELSYLFLAVAAGIKMYPALFAAILLKERRFSDFAKTVVYTVALFFLPFLCFSGGFSNIKVFLNNLFSFQNNGQASDHNYSMATFFLYIAEFAKGLKLTYVPGWTVSAGRILSFFMLFIGLAASLFVKEKWKTFTLVAISMIVFPAPSYVYSACVLLPPAAMFLFRENKTKKDYIYLALFLIMLSPVQLGYLVSPKYIRLGLPLKNFFEHIAMLVVFGMLVWEAVKNVSDWIRSRKGNQPQEIPAD